MTAHELVKALLDEDAMLEGLILSDSAERMLNWLDSWQLKPELNSGQPNHQRVRIGITISPQWTHNQVIQFNRELDTRGWYASYWERGNQHGKVTDAFWSDKILKGNNPVFVQIEPKYDEPAHVSAEAQVYHVTPFRLVNKILKNGLVPKSEGKLSKHPDRIYLSYGGKAAKIILQQLRSRSIMLNKPEDFAVIKVDFNSIKNPKVDPNFDGGFYVTDYIPASALTQVPEESLGDEEPFYHKSSMWLRHGLGIQNRWPSVL